MKYSKRADMYTASNVSYSPEKRQALSYHWWTFVKVIGGLTVFNAHNYSATTIKHQYKVRALMNELGHNIDLIVDTRLSLTDNSWPHDAIMRLKNEAATIQGRLDSNRRGKHLDLERQSRLVEIAETINLIQRLDV
jgi:hypothetical protein